MFTIKFVDGAVATASTKEECNSLIVREVDQLDFPNGAIIIYGEGTGSPRQVKKDLGGYYAG